MSRRFRWADGSWARWPGSEQLVQLNAKWERFFRHEHQQHPASMKYRFSWIGDSLRLWMQGIWTKTLKIIILAQSTRSTEKGTCSMILTRTKATVASLATVIGLAVATPGTAEATAVSTTFTTTQANAVPLSGRLWSWHHTSEATPPGSALAPLNGHVLFSRRGYKVDASSATIGQVPSADFAQLKTYFKSVNRAIYRGELTMGSDGIATPAAKHADGRVVPNRTWRGRHGYIRTHWYGLQVTLDSYLANKVIGGFWVGTGIAALAAALGGGPYAAAIAAVLGIAAGALQLCQNSDYRVTVYFLGSIGVGGWVCNPFA
jgi:hypothetical protein